MHPVSKRRIMSAPIIICILGMHRSGTSVSARILNLLGVYLGPPNRLLAAAPDNPRGFWEHEPIMKLNDQILNRLGGGAIDPPPTPPHWQDHPACADLRQAACALVQADFRDAPLWGWKDPRTCLTLPLWQAILPSMRYVLCLRHSLEVVGSLGQRDGLSTEWALHLWLIYLRCALLHTAGRPRLLLCYEDLLDRWREKLPALAAFIGRPEKAERPEVCSAIKAFVDAGLRRHRTHGNERAALDGPSPAAEAAQIAQGIYDHLRETGLTHDHIALAMIDRAIDVLAPEVRRQKTQHEERAAREWSAHQATLERSLRELIPEGETFILVDQAQTEATVAGRRAVPFVERDGVYWGWPPDDEVAVNELERLRHSGANFLALAWPAFGWLEYYPGFFQYLCQRFPCLCENDSLTLFDLRVKTSRTPD
jgi:hypothetical protein